LRGAVAAERRAQLVGRAVAEHDRVRLPAELPREPAASETAPSEFLLNAPS
jgi:hypothetical protein